MWMCYVQEIPITDLKSGVQHLLQKFNNLEFDAEHAAVYDMGYGEEECHEVADNYSKGATVCEQFLEGSICESCLVGKIFDLDLDRFLYCIEQYLTPENRHRLHTSNDADWSIEDRNEEPESSVEDRNEEPK